MLDWQKVGSFYYRTRDVYAFPTSLGRSEVVDAKYFLAKDSNHVAICPCGGPVAVLDPGRNRLIIFTPSFRMIAETTLDLKATPIGIWWTTDSEPVINISVSDGTTLSVFIRPGGACLIDQTKLRSRVISVSANSNSTSAVYLTDKMELLRSPDIVLSQMDSEVICFCVIRNECVLVSLESGSLILINQAQHILIEGSNEPSLQIQLIALSLSGNFLATHTANGAVTVYSVSDLMQNPPILKPVESSLLDIGIPPRQLCWVGDDCLCLTFSDPSARRNVLFLGGVGGSWSPYEHDSPVHVCSDLLSASVLTCSKFQVIQRVCQPAVNIASNPSSPEALLLSGYEKHLANDLSCESVIRAVKDQLNKAVNSLCEAAAFETPVILYKDLISHYLKASIFGRQFSTMSTVVGSSLFVNSAGLIRLCYALNSPEIGIPISVPQLMALGPRSQAGGGFLVQCLAGRGLFSLALRVAKWLGVSNGPVINRWACALIGSSDNLPDRELCETIMQRVPQNHSLAEIARFAYKEVGRKKLATLLLQREPNVHNQVELLLNLDSEELAIQKSLEAEDIDLIHVCFDSLIASQKSLHELITMKSSNLSNAQVTLMLSLVQARYYSESKYDELCKLLQTIPGSDLLMADSALELACNKFSSLGPNPSLSKSEESADWVQYSAERFAECVSAPSVVSVNPGQLLTNSPQGCQSTASLLAECSQLIRAQVQLEKTAASKGWPRGPHKFVGLSLDETLRRLVLLNENVEAENLRTKRKVSDGKWWEFRVRTLLTTEGRIEEGISFANSVVPPSTDCRGYKVVVETLLSLKRDDLALPFIKKLKPKKQVEIYNQLGLFEDARAAELQRPSGMPGAGLLGRLASGLIGNR
jgi:hypothetical protein